MWKCKKCGRIFKKDSQPHSCQKVALKKHFMGKKIAKELFDDLVKKDKLQYRYKQNNISSMLCAFVWQI